MLYPLVFKPILKKMIWGGSAICPFKEIEPVREGIGESWELSHVNGNFSIVAEGALEGRSLDELVGMYGAKLLGHSIMERFGSVFPLLIKFIDAHDDLSIQVHPDDELAMKRHNSFGKTEMWYVIHAEEGASLYSGFKQQIDADEYVRRVKDNTITEVLQRYEVKAGDVFFLPAGRVHAICSGCFIAEVQQTSDITYRIYDYNRKDADGNGRELHTEQAKDAIDYTVYPDYRTHYDPVANETVELAGCKYFTANLLDLDKTIMKNVEQLDSFIVYICVEGSAVVVDDKFNRLYVCRGETLLVPADTEIIAIAPSPRAKFLEVYI
ncbi:MAG: class I mannose-6-phosphate isomerase [Tannerellaceae bacterium]|jgi:mannose-6-phosphate isomerase|nr:class I mannose-6-phosphate isomerase [Tannerellaceae bacterium]